MAHSRTSCAILRPSLQNQQEQAVAKGQQRSTKEAKKPKKDTSPPKPVAPLAPAVTTVVAERGKKKGK
jgi:hypothetical protein